MLADSFSQTTALISAIIWPFVVIVALILYRRELSGFLIRLGGRISLVSFGPASVEFVPASEAPPNVVSAVTDFIDATSAVSGIASDAGPSLELAIHTTGSDFVKIDIRGGRAWLTSRLYIFSVIFSETAKMKRIIFVQRSDDGLETFVGSADPLAAVDRLGSRFRWFRYALADAERQVSDSQPSDLAELIRPFADLQWASRVAEQYIIHPLIRAAAYAGADREKTNKFSYVEGLPAGDPPQLMLPVLNIPPPGRQLPVISGVAPAVGPITGGTMVNITGEGFGGVEEVRFGSSLAAIANVTATAIRITAVSPPGHGDVTVKVLTPAGSSTTTDDWVTIRSSDGSVHDEHAAWIRDGHHLRRLLGDALDTTCVIETAQGRPADLAAQILRERGDFVVIVGPGNQFRRLIDRRASVEHLVKNSLKDSPVP